MQKKEVHKKKKQKSRDNHAQKELKHALAVITTYPIMNPCSKAKQYIEYLLNDYFHDQN